MKLPRPILSIWNSISRWFSSVHWNTLQGWINGGSYYRLTADDHERLYELLSKNYGIILTRRDSHLTTYLIAWVSKLLTGKPVHYVHALMNTEGVVEQISDFRIIEATNAGVHYNDFDHTFDCDSVAVLVPKGIVPEQWTIILDKIKLYHGVKYDTVFDLTNDEKVSCVELIYLGLQTLPDYQSRFPKLIAMIREEKNLTPQMLYDCGEFDIVFEVRR